MADKQRLCRGWMCQAEGQSPTGTWMENINREHKNRCEHWLGTKERWPFFRSKKMSCIVALVGAKVVVNQSVAAPAHSGDSCPYGRLPAHAWAGKRASLETACSCQLTPAHAGNVIQMVNIRLRVCTCWASESQWNSSFTGGSDSMQVPSTQPSGGLIGAS